MGCLFFSLLLKIQAPCWIYFLQIPSFTVWLTFLLYSWYTLKNREVFDFSMVQFISLLEFVLFVSCQEIFAYCKVKKYSPILYFRNFFYLLNLVRVWSTCSSFILPSVGIIIYIAQLIEKTILFPWLWSATFSVNQVGMYMYTRAHLYAHTCLILDFYSIDLI